MTAYEYVYVDRRDIDRINELGAQGWRVLEAELAPHAHQLMMERAKDPAIVVTMQDGAAATLKDHEVTYWFNPTGTSNTVRCTCGWSESSPHWEDVKAAARSHLAAP